MSVEDLWDLSFKELNELYKALNRKKIQNKEEDLYLFADSVKNDADEYLDLQLEIIKHVTKTRAEEVKTKEKLAAKRADQKRIRKILASRKDASLEALSDEELKSFWIHKDQNNKRGFGLFFFCGFHFLLIVVRDIRERHVRPRRLQPYAMG